MYEELSILTAQRLAHEPPAQTLRATARVHEAYLWLVEDEPQSWNRWGHFFAAATDDALGTELGQSGRQGKPLTSLAVISDGA